MATILAFLITEVIGTIREAIKTLLFGPLLQRVRQWHRAALFSLGVWIFAAILGATFTGSAVARWVVILAASCSVTVFIAFVVLVARDRQAMTNVDPDTWFACSVQGGVAVVVWTILVVVLGVSIGLSLVEDDIVNGIEAVLWTSADSIPTLAIPETFGWDKPIMMPGFHAGWLLLLARVAFLVSILAIGKAIYETAVHRRREGE